MAAKLVKADPTVVAEFETAFSPEGFGTCALEDYEKIPVPSFHIASEFICYASPDSTYAVTKRLMDHAQHSILIGIYDFTAGYMSELLKKAMQRGVEVSLMLDLDGRTGETPLFEDLVAHGCQGVSAPSCASEHVHYFGNCHEKVIVIDSAWVLVQSGNYSHSSIPQNEVDGGARSDFIPGNRDMGIAIHSKPLAAFFSKILRNDMKLTLEAMGGEAAPGEDTTRAAVTVMEAAPSQPPTTLFRSKTVTPSAAVRVTPVLSPDNYMQVIPDLLRSATKSLYIEQQYIRSGQPHIQTLLAAIRDVVAAHADLEVRIILAPPKFADDFTKMERTLKDLRNDFNLRMGTHIRWLNPKHFVHCHNKLIIVDKQRVLVSSQNWSDMAVSRNREAGVLIHHAPIARYYAKIFTSDWETGLTKIRRGPSPELFAPESLPTGKVVPLNWGDYTEV